MFSGPSLDLGFTCQYLRNVKVTLRKCILFVFALTNSVVLAIPQAPKEPLSLWYCQPAKQWVEALPVGNGRLGAMVFGGVSQEQIQLNEDTLWGGGPYNPANPEALEALPKVRELIFAGQYREADRLIGQKMMAKPISQMPYQCVGDLMLTFPEATQVVDYRRDLNLDTAVATVAYTIEGIRYKREVFSSPVDQVIVIRLTADQPGKISFTAGMKTPQKVSITVDSAGTLVMDGVNGSSRGIEGALKFQARVSIKAAGGQVTSSDEQVTVSNANSVILLIAVATSYKNYQDVSGDPASLTKTVLDRASAKSFEALLKDHVQEHQRLFRRVSLDLGTTSAAQRPTDERIADLDKVKDPQLAALYFQFGRYLLISSSRPGTQPANLQGIWNDSMSPPWQSKYTININTEMNYWPAEPTNLSECIEPLVSMVMDLSQSGQRTAKTCYGADGWVTHHNTDLWRATAPIDGPQWGMWPMGGAWLSLHLWDHYDYHRDKSYLSKIYPALKGSATFFLDTLVEDPQHHWLVTSPSLSPENHHPFGTSICAGPTMDMQILRDLFTHCIEAAEILGIDEDFRLKVNKARSRLAPNQIGSNGQLQEWLEDWDMQAPWLDHRHVSHLYGLYPSDQINVHTTPELAAAARKSLEIRGDEATGWGIGWRLNLWARLHEAEHAYKILTMLLRPERTYPNMFDAHPPFQIDGNFGGTSGIAEMFMQSCAGEIDLLPALPQALPYGSVKGLCARGGFELDIQWKDGKLLNVTVRSLVGGTCKLRYGAVTKELSMTQGQTAQWNGKS